MDDTSKTQKENESYASGSKAQVLHWDNEKWAQTANTITDKNTCEVATISEDKQTMGLQLLLLLLLLLLFLLF